MTDRPDHDNLEIERRYLLSGVPELPEGADVWRISQGYLPGDKLRERLRRVEHKGRTHYIRTVKFGQGVERVEVEDTCDEDIFEVLWSLTVGCRLEKTRHRVREGGLTWEIDVFDSLPLVMAEVELESADEVPTPPGWLAGVIVREVTEDGRYTNLALASHGIP